jgi:hypothetical protein
MAEKAKCLIEPSRPGTGMIGRWTGDMESEGTNNSLDNRRIAVYGSLKATNQTVGNSKGDIRGTAKGTFVNVIELSTQVPAMVRVASM